MEILLELAKIFGPTAAVLMWITWRDGKRDEKRELRQEARLLENDKWVKELFLPAIQNSTKALEATAQVIGENNVILTGIHQVIQTHVLITEATNKILVRLTKPAKAARKR